MITAMNDIFMALVPSDGEADFDGYYIKSDNAEDANYLQNTTVKAIDNSSFYPFKIGLLAYGSDQFLFIANSNYEFSAPENFSELEMNAGLFSLIVSEAKVERKKSISDSELVDKVFYYELGTPEYKGHDFRDLIDYFNDIYLYKLDDSVGASIYKCFAEFLIFNMDFLSTVNDESTIALLQSSLEIRSEVIWELIANGLFSKNYNHTLVDFYKLLEILYPVQYINSLYTKVNQETLSFKNFYDVVIDELGWRPIEAQAITKLYSSLSETTQLRIKEEFRKISTSEENIPKFIYQTRCLIVHRRFGQTNLSFSADEWNVLYRIIMEMANKLHIDYRGILEE